MAEPYTLPAGGRDVLRNFVLPIPVSNTRYVRGIEFRPGNNRVVHHANMRIDRTGVSSRLDATDGQPGFDGFITTASFPDGHFLGWTPGQLPPLASDDLAWRLDPGSDLVLQLHMQPTDATEVVQAAVGLFFADRAPARTPLMLRLGRQNIDIIPGTSHYVEEDAYVLPVDVEVRAVQPHAHYRAREVRSFATLPDGTRKWLLYIKDWDFNWQDVYRYARPFTLPRGTTLRMQYIFDNSPTNRRNPDRPPKRVRWGQNSTDEMGDVWVQVLTRTTDDRNVLHDDFGRKVMTEDAAGYETSLQSDPGNARLHEAVAAIYLVLNRPDKAIAHLTDSLRINPESLEAHYNLATALVRQQRLDEAVDHFQQALRINPDHAAVHVNLGVVLRAQNQLDAATEHFQRALQLDPGNAAAHTNLGGTLAVRHQLAEAIRQYRLALQTDPDLLEALTDLAWILATSRDVDIRAPAEAVRLAERAAALTGRRSVRALETAAAAYAANSQLAQAVAAQQRAVDLADAAGSRSVADQLRVRLDLYRRGSPYYEP
jgi:tetratricopeptide (TPR) repeat protein